MCPFEPWRGNYKRAKQVGWLVFAILKGTPPTATHLLKRLGAIHFEPNEPAYSGRRQTCVPLHDQFEQMYAAGASQVRIDV